MGKVVSNKPYFFSHTRTRDLGMYEVFLATLILVGSVCNTSKMDRQPRVQTMHAAQDVVCSVIETVVLPATHYAVKRGRLDPIVAGMRLREAEAPTPFETTKSLRGRWRPARGTRSRAHWDERRDERWDIHNFTSKTVSSKRRDGSRDRRWDKQ